MTIKSNHLLQRLGDLLKILKIDVSLTADQGESYIEDVFRWAHEADPDTQVSCQFPFTLSHMTDTATSLD